MHCFILLVILPAADLGVGMVTQVEQLAQAAQEVALVAGLLGEAAVVLEEAAAVLEEVEVVSVGVVLGEDLAVVLAEALQMVTVSNRVCYVPKSCLDCMCRLCKAQPLVVHVLCTIKEDCMLL